MSGADREALLRAYLLGTLSPEEQEPIDRQVVEDEVAHEELLATQDDLIHAYLAGGLSDADRERFESHFLASPRRRERVAFIRSLMTAVSREDSPAAAPTVAPITSARHAAPSHRWTAALPWAAMVAVGLAGGAWSVGERRRADREIAGAQERERALAARIDEQRRQIETLQGQVDADDVVTWDVEDDAQRGPDRPAVYQARPAGSVRLRASLPPGPHGALVASLQTPDGAELQRVPGLRAQEGPSGPFVDVFVSASLLRHGTYVLSIQLDHGARGELKVGTLSVR